MARGRKPNPVTLKILRGNPSKRPITSPASSPFVAGIPPKPKDLDADAATEWDRLTRELDGVLCVADAGILRVTVDAYAMFRQAQRALQQHGLTYTTTGEAGLMVRARPEARILDSSRRAYLHALSELGATPAQHARVQSLPSGDTPDDRDSGIHKFFRPEPNRG